MVYWAQHDTNQPAVAALKDRDFHRWIDAYALVSHWQRQAYIRDFGLPPDRAFALENAVAPAFQNLFAAPAELAAAKSSVLKLAYTSTPFRGLSLLAALFPGVRQEFPQAELHVFSSMKVYQQAEENDEQRPLYERCRNTPGVVFHGSLPQPELAVARVRRIDPQLPQHLPGDKLHRRDGGHGRRSVRRQQPPGSLAGNDPGAGDARAPGGGR